MGTYRDPSFDPSRPGHVAVRDKDTHQVVRWEQARERENPTMFEAKNPDELVVQENPDGTSHNDSNTMERENAVTEIANDFMEKAKPGLGIVAGNAVAAELFDYIDRGPLNSQSTTVRKSVRVFGPGVLGVLVGRVSDSEIVRSVALGHVTESVRAGVEEALAFVSNGKMGSPKGEDETKEQPDSGTQGYAPQLSGMEVSPAGQLEGGYSSQNRSGTPETEEETVM
jgi:hypothetical protein